MLTSSKLISQGRGLAAVLLKRAAVVELDWDVRQKSRFEAADSLGRRVGVFLPRGTVVRGGDVLVVEDGSLLRVVAAPQAVLRITPCAAHGSAFDLVRAAYHLGNRHVPIELHPSHLQIEPDHVLAEMLQQMHLIVTPMEAAFEPENGAYGGGGHGDGHRHHHAHAHDEGHHHHHDGQAHEHNNTHTPKGKPIGIAVVGAAVPHVHGPDCGHGH